MKFSEFLRKALSEDNGHPSSMRTMVFTVTVQFSAVLTYGFINTVINHPELTIAYAGLLLSVILGTLGIKGWQKTNEDKTNAPEKEQNGTPTTN
jgi:hypothetical protein